MVNHSQIVTDAEVRVMRQMRFDGVSYDQLAKRFELHKKTVERLCRGFERRNAGGVLEAGPGRPQSHGPFDLNSKIRCPGCGALVHPPCFKCTVETDKQSTVSSHW